MFYSRQGHPATILMTSIWMRIDHQKGSNPFLMLTPSIFHPKLHCALAGHAMSHSHFLL